MLSQPEPWPARAPGQPRRAAVSGFGFGGINAHVLIEEWAPKEERKKPILRPTGRPPPDAPVAIVGISAHFGPFVGRQAFQERVLGAENRDRPAGPRNWWGATETHWYRRQGWDDRSFPGFYLESLEVRAGQFRIPPKELGEMLPQQSLMLRLAAEAILDAALGPVARAPNRRLDRDRAGLERDQLPPSLVAGRSAREWNGTLGFDLSPGTLTVGSRNCVRRQGRLCQPTERWGHWAA